MMWLWLARVIGVRRLAGWAARLLVLALLLFVLAVLFAVWHLFPDSQPVIIGLAIGGLSWMAYQAWRARGSVEEAAPVEQGERTIDGKVVPDKLAVAALSIPAISADGESVLRALPDYGKALLKLDSEAFAYLPPPPELPAETASPALLPASPAAMQTGLSVPRWVLGLAIAIISIIAYIIFTRQDDRRRSTDGDQVAASFQEQSLPNPVANNSETTLPSGTPMTDSDKELLSNSATRQTPASGAGEGVSHEAPTTQDAASSSNDAVASAKAALASYAQAVTLRDPSTGQLWTKNDNGPKPIGDFESAQNYCKSAEIGGFSGWRVPTEAELRDVWHQEFSDKFKLSRSEETFWTSTRDTDGVHHVVVGASLPEGADIHDYTHVLCVHD